MWETEEESEFWWVMGWIWIERMSCMYALSGKRETEYTYWRSIEFWKCGRWPTLNRWMDTPFAFLIPINVDESQWSDYCKSESWGRRPCVIHNIIRRSELFFYLYYIPLPCFLVFLQTQEYSLLSLQEIVVAIIWIVDTERIVRIDIQHIIKVQVPSGLVDMAIVEPRGTRRWSGSDGTWCRIIHGRWRQVYSIMRWFFTRADTSNRCLMGNILVAV